MWPGASPQLPLRPGRGQEAGGQPLSVTQTAREHGVPGSPAGALQCRPPCSRVHVCFLPASPTSGRRAWAERLWGTQNLLPVSLGGAATYGHCGEPRFPSCLARVRPAEAPRLGRPRALPGLPRNLSRTRSRESCHRVPTSALTAPRPLAQLGPGCLALPQPFQTPRTPGRSGRRSGADPPFTAYTLRAPRPRTHRIAVRWGRRRTGRTSGVSLRVLQRRWRVSCVRFKGRSATAKPCSSLYSTWPCPLPQHAEPLRKHSSRSS